MHYVGLLAIFVALYFVCAELERACSAIAHRYRIPESIAGATLLAVSSSSPEFFTAFLGAVFFGSFEIGLMAILWSAIFNITVIPGLSAVVAPGPLKVYPTVLLRDSVAYLAVALLLIALMGDGMLTRNDALVLLGAYFLYVYVLFLMLGAGEEVEPLVLPNWRVAAGLLGGIAAVGVLCHYMVEFGLAIAASWAIPVGLISALVFAPGTSVPDLLLSLIAARKGAGSASISNAFGSNSFDLTVCLAAPILVVGDVSFEFSGRALYSVWMLIGTVVLSMLFVRTGYELTRREGWVLLALFVVLAAAICVLPESAGHLQAE
ncbi:MAG: sodium:calcium antiporter [Planctomycetota bacterium]|nr:MAG: sodium:calcium antiporter [Planctomycetota bacterium]